MPLIRKNNTTDVGYNMGAVRKFVHVFMSCNLEVM